MTAEFSVVVSFSHVGLHPLAGYKGSNALYDPSSFFSQSCIQAHPESKTFRRQLFSLFVDPFFFVVSRTADPESKSLRRQPFSPSFERRLLFVDSAFFFVSRTADPVSYTHLRAHETRHDLV